MIENLSDQSGVMKCPKCGVSFAWYSEADVIFSTFNAEQMAKKKERGRELLAIIRGPS